MLIIYWWFNCFADSCCWLLSLNRLHYLKWVQILKKTYKKCEDSHHLKIPKSRSIEESQTQKDTISGIYFPAQLTLLKEWRGKKKHLWKQSSKAQSWECPTTSKLRVMYSLCFYSQMVWGFLYCCFSLFVCLFFPLYVNQKPNYT